MSGSGKQAESPPPPERGGRFPNPPTSCACKLETWVGRALRQLPQKAPSWTPPRQLWTRSRQPSERHSQGVPAAGLRACPLPHIESCPQTQEAAGTVQDARQGKEAQTALRGQGPSQGTGQVGTDSHTVHPHKAPQGQLTSRPQAAPLSQPCSPARSTTLLSRSKR